MFELDLVARTLRSTDVAEIRKVQQTLAILLMTGDITPMQMREYVGELQVRINELQKKKETKTT